MNGTRAPRVPEGLADAGRSAVASPGPWGSGAMLGDTSAA
jgi:hypothetical protein